MKKNLKFLASFVLVILIFAVPSAIHGMDNKADIYYDSVRTIMQKHLTTNHGLLNSSKDKDIVVFLGNTGAGKSTLINYLSAKKLQVNDIGDIVLREPNDPSAMGIGVGAISHTFLPNFIDIDAGGLLFYDLPGFKGTGETPENLLTACFIKRIIENAKSTRLIFVAGADQITGDRGMSFIELLDAVKKLIPNESIESFSSLIITKSDVKWGNLGKFLVGKINLGALGGVNPWMMNGRISQMSKPTQGIIDEGERDAILDLICKTSAKKIKEINTSVIYRAQNQSFIKKIYNLEMEEIVNELGGKKLEEFKLVNKNNIGELKNKFYNEALQKFKTSKMVGLIKEVTSTQYDDAVKRMKMISDKGFQKWHSEAAALIQQPETSLWPYAIGALGGGGVVYALRARL